MIRELVMHVAEAPLADEALADLLRELDADVKAFADTMEMAHTPALSEAGVDPHTIELVAEAHSDTWLSVEGAANITQVKKGSKPGDNLGDIVFNYIMVAILRDIAQQLLDEGLAVRV